MSPPTAAPAKPADALNPPGLLATVTKLWPYLWPHGRPDLQRRVFMAFGLLLVAKGITMVTPFAFKWATDALVAVSGGGGNVATQAATAGDWLWRAPILLTILYGLTRVLMAVLTQMRDGLFAKVAMHAVRKLALQTFEHMHRLSLRFHLERKTGGLTRVLERGREGIEELSRLVVLTLLPTIFEFGLVLGILAWEFDWTYSAVVLAMVVVYLAYTYQATEWRISIRTPHERIRHRRQHQGGRFASQLRDREIFRRRGARGDPLRPLDGALRESLHPDLHVACRAQCGPGGDLLHRHDHRDGAGGARHRGGPRLHRQLRARQRHAGAALHSAEFHGDAVPRDQTGADRHRRHVQDSRPQSRDPGQAGRQAAAHHARRRALRRRAFRLQSRARDPEGRELRGPGRPHHRHRRSVGCGQIDHLAAPLSLLRAIERTHPHRRAGHRGRSADEPAQGHRHGPAGHRAVQRHHRLQRAIRPLGRRRPKRSRKPPASRRSTVSSATCRKVSRPRSASAA